MYLIFTVANPYFQEVTRFNSWGVLQLILLNPRTAEEAGKVTEGLFRRAIKTHSVRRPKQSAVKHSFH